jgi:hypothetical protein
MQKSYGEIADIFNGTVVSAAILAANCRRDTGAFISEN